MRPWQRWILSPGFSYTPPTGRPAGRNGSPPYRGGCTAGPPPEYSGSRCPWTPTGRSHSTRRRSASPWYLPRSGSVRWPCPCGSKPPRTPPGPPGPPPAGGTTGRTAPSPRRRHRRTAAAAPPQWQSAASSAASGLRAGPAAPSPGGPPEGASAPGGSGGRSPAPCPPRFGGPVHTAPGSRPSAPGAKACQTASYAYPSFSRRSFSMVRPRMTRTATVDSFIPSRRAISRLVCSSTSLSSKIRR